MDKSGKLIVMCGKVASGKTTFARRFAENNDVMYISVDEWMLGIHGMDVPCSKHPGYIADIIRQLSKDIRKMLVLGMTVVMDFGFWTKDERDTLRNAVSPFPVEIYYIPIEEEEQKQRLLERNERALKHHETDTYVMNLETLEALNQRFESPLGEVNVTSIKVDRLEELI